ncbi:MULTISPECIES: hypothetical protein [unclassified Ornithinimicrobium]|uniref:hypothetical protein n=1 Tax=unclassified Ornithinimicrobium TaxID=2615080 RepID=UPI0038542DC2
MTDPTGLPFQDDPDRSDGESIYEGRRPGTEARAQPEDDGTTAVEGTTGTGPATDISDLLPPSETETDLLAARVEGPDDRAGMTALWRATMGLEHWWFVAVGDEGMESPAAASIDDQMMLLTFTNAERARHFAVQHGMIGAAEDLRAIALPPDEVVRSADDYRTADIAGLMFDPHLSGYFMPTDQLAVVWEAVHAG